MKQPGTVFDIIGNTPLLEMKGEWTNANRVYAKVEASNPGGSVKDRIAYSMIKDAEKAHVITPHVSTIIEPTSGNTGIALAMVGASRGYTVVLTMPESMSLERRALLKAHGAQIVLTPAAEGMNGAVKEAKRLAEGTKDGWMPNQFENPATPRAHYETTGPEIAAALGGKAPDVFICGVGTGGTLSGAGRYLKELNPDLMVVAVEPTESPIITQYRAGGEIKPGPHGIQGIGPNFIPKTLDLDLIDDVVTVSTPEAIEAAREISFTDGLVCGITSGANALAAKEFIARASLSGKTVVTVLPDTGERYFSTPLWSDMVG